LPLWNGDSGKRIVVYGEQGIGDEIMFASCVPDLQAMSELVVLDCHPRLTTLFKRSFGVDCYGTRKDEWLDWVLPYKFNARTPIGSLPRLSCGRTASSRKAVPEDRPECRGRRAARPEDRAAWSGGYKETRAAIRSMPLAELYPILGMDASFVSLQYTDSAAEIAHIERNAASASISSISSRTRNPTTT
jgi:hypothetical protein